MSYKFYKSITTKSLELVNGVSVSFELTNNNKNNVYILTDLYTSSYKFPISLGLIKRVGDNINYGYGEGSNLSLLYKLNTTKLSSDNKLILTHPHMEEEEFILESGIFKSKTSDGKIFENEMEYIFESKSCNVVFEKFTSPGIFRNKEIIIKQNDSYKLTLTYDSNSRLLKIENEAVEKESVEFTYTNSLLTSIKAYKNGTLLENIVLNYGGYTLYGVKKSLYNTTSYQYDVSHTFGEDDDENQYLEYVDNIKGISTKLYLSGGTVGFVNLIVYPLNTISISYSNVRTRIYNNTTYEDVLYSYDGTLLCVKNSEGFIKTYSYNETFFLNDYKKLNVESSSLFEVASKNGEVIEGSLRGLLYNELTSNVACPSGRNARVLTFKEYDTSTEDGFDFYKFDIKGGRLDVFSALIYAKVKSIPSTLSSINVSFKLKFKNKAGELLHSTILNEVVLNISDSTNWYEQLIIGQAPSSFESVELEVLNTYSYGEQLYFDVVLYKGNLGTSYMYDVNGNVVRLLKGSELTGLKISSNNKLESTSLVVCSYDEKGRMIQSVDINNTTSRFTYDDESNITKKTSTYKNGFVEEEVSVYQNGEHLLKETKDGIETTFEYDDKKRRIGASTIIENEGQGVKIEDVVEFDDGNSVNYGSINNIYFKRGNITESNYVGYNMRKNIGAYADTSSGRLYEFFYDSLNRITSVKYNLIPLIYYIYDDKGNVSQYRFSDEGKWIRNVFNSISNTHVPYGALTSIYYDNYDDNISEEIYRMNYNNKKLVSTLNRKSLLMDQYSYDYDKLKGMIKTLNNRPVFELETKHNHFDQKDETHTIIGNYTHVNKVSDSSNLVNKNVIGLDYALSSKDDSSLYWTFFAPRVTTIDGVRKDISCDLLNKEAKISLDTKDKNITYVSNGLKFMKVPYSDEKKVYNLGSIRNMSLLMELDIPSGNGELFIIRNENNIYLTIIKEGSNTIVKIYNSTQLINQSTISKNIIGHHVLSLNIDSRNVTDTTYIFDIDIFVDGVKETNITFTSAFFINRLELNGFNQSTNNKYGAIILRKYRVFTDRELKDYIRRINEVYENKDVELKPSNIAYNEIKYKYDEIIFNNTFESRNGIKPIRQINDDSFYSIKENFEYVPSLRGEGIGDNVYAIKGQELVYDLGLETSGTIALRYKPLLGKEATLLHLYSGDLDIVIKSLSDNKLYASCKGEELILTYTDTNDWKDVIVTFMKGLESESLETKIYVVKVFINGEEHMFELVSASNEDSTLYVSVGKGKDDDIYSEELVGFIDKLVYTDIECDEEEVSSICTHLNHNEYCYNQSDFASRLESKTINTSSDKVIKKVYTYNNSISNISRVPLKEVLSINGVTKETNNYTYDSLKRVKTISNSEGVKRYTYDNKGYLTTFVDGTTTYNYSYDNFGNITNNNGITLTYDGQLLRRYGSTVINYNGMYPINEVVNGVVTKTYDWLGSKLSGVISDKSYLFDYNARGLRERKLVKVSTVTEQEIYYFYDLNDRLIAETRYKYTSTGLKTKMCDIIYMYDATGLLYGFKYNNVEYYYDRDILGNINHIILANGQVVVTYKYDAYGSHKVYNLSGVEETSSSFIGNINPFRYKGYYYDVETGLYYLKTRYYNPLWGRFISPDNVKYLDPKSINGLNLYAYCDNDPVNKFDPSGCVAWWVVALIASAVLIFCKSDSENINYKYDEDYADDEDQRIKNDISKFTCSDGTIIYYKITKSNDIDKSSIKIINSYLYTEKQICELLDYISETKEVYLNYELIINEWKWHSLAYGIGFSRDSTASVDVYFNSEDTGHGIFSWVINNWFI